MINISKESKCWVCGEGGMSSIKPSDIVKELDSSDFAITDSQYGKTAEIFLCHSCGFMQCSNMNDVVKFYEDLEDLEYEESRNARLKQSEKIIKGICKFKTSGRLLDIGAGSGILVEKATEIGFFAEGLEPSKWLSDQANSRGIPVHNKILPIKKMNSSYDVVTLIDVIDHVPNPIEILSQIHDVLNDDGVGVVVTPDVSSLMARLLGWKWWHFRFAHIGYFNLSNIELSLNKANLEIIKVERPSWYFPLDYLIERVNIYLPRIINIPNFKFASRIIMPLNLGDSLLIYFKRR